MLFRFLFLLLACGGFAPLARAQTLADTNSQPLDSQPLDSQPLDSQPLDSQSLAERAFAEKSYASALVGFRAAKANKTAREIERVDYQIVTALFKLERWDEAIRSANYALAQAKWRARFHVLLGQILVRAPKNGTQIGARIWRGNTYPLVANAPTPTPVYLAEADERDALEQFELAKIEAQRERDLVARARFSGPIYPLTRDEEIDLNFDLAAYLPQTQFTEFLTSLERNPAQASVQAPQNALGDAARYNREWILPRKVLALYAEIRALDQSADRAPSARSLLAEGLFIRAYQSRMNGWAPHYDVALKRRVNRPYPFQSLDPIAVWGRLSTRPIAPLALTLGA